MKVLYIEWIDAVSDNAWSSPKDHDVHNVKTIGWLVNETERAYIVSVSMSIDDNKVECNGTMSIPKAWIKRKRIIKL